jgi:hypothetical protein
MHSKPSRNTSIPISSTADARFSSDAGEVELPRTANPVALRIPTIRRMPTRRIASQTIHLRRELRKNGMLAILCVGTGIASSAVLNPCLSAPDEFVLKSRLLFLFRFLRESLPNGGRVVSLPLCRESPLWPLACCAKAQKALPNKREMQPRETRTGF